jgi:hypothetical protein
MANNVILKKINPQPNNANDYETQVVLDGNRYGFRFYNAGPSAFRDAWYMSVYNPVDNSLVVGTKKVSVGTSLLEQYRYKGTDLIPPGQIICVDLRTQFYNTETNTFEGTPGFDPTYNSFRDETHAIYYVPEEYL